jgi:hypothetical protein
MHSHGSDHDGNSRLGEKFRSHDRRDLDALFTAPHDGWPDHIVADRG